jgi:hypothetical protein
MKIIDTGNRMIVQANDYVTHEEPGVSGRAALLKGDD